MIPGFVGRRSALHNSRRLHRRSLAARIATAAICLLAMGCQAGGDRNTGSDTAPVVTGDGVGSTGGANPEQTSPSAPALSTPELGDDIARLLKKPPPLGEVLEIDAYSFLKSSTDAMGKSVTMGQATSASPVPLTDQPYFAYQARFTGSSFVSPPQGAPWIWTIGDFPDEALPTWPSRPVRYRLRGRLEEREIAAGAAPTRVFVVDEVLSSKPVDCLPGDCELVRASPEWQTFRDEANGITLPVPPAWEIRAKGRRRTEFIAPYHNEWPIELEVLDKEFEADTHGPAAGEQWVGWWSEYRVRVKPGEVALKEGKEIACFALDQRQRPNVRHCVGVAISQGGRSWILRLHYPIGYGAAPGQFRYFEAMLDGIEIEGWPTVTPMPTPRSEIGAGPFKRP